MKQHEAAATTVVVAAQPRSGSSTTAQVLRHLQESLNAAMHLTDVFVGRHLEQDVTSASVGLSSSNALVVSITLHPPPVGSGSDTGSVLLALQNLIGNQLAVPGARSKLAYKQVVSVTRSGTCGDGVCQVRVPDPAFT